MPTLDPCRTRVRIASAIAVIASLGLLLHASTARAGVYKCATENGASVYQENPCPAGKELRNFETDPPPLSVIPGPPPPSAPAASSAAPRAAPGPAPEKAAKRSAPAHDDRAHGKVNGDATERKFIRAGMSEAEVMAKIGRPDMTAGGSKGRQTRWSYLPHPYDPEIITTIIFNGDVVSDVTRKLVKR